MRRTLQVPTLALFWLALAGAAQAQSTAETADVTEDGLVRVPSTRKAGVYRAPDVPFTQYQRIELGQVTVKFRKTWEKDHRNLKKDDVEEIRGDLASWFREALYKELIDRGGYPLADLPTKDTLRVEASILEVDITAPDAGQVLGQKIYTRSAGSMKLVVELRDAASGVLVGRIIDFEQAREYDKPQLASQINNADEFRDGFEKAARYTREALNVAKTEKPKP